MTPCGKIRGKISSRPCKRAWQGFGLVSAVFLLVVLAGLGAAIANLSVMQHKGEAMDVQQARVYQAARAGIEWGLYDSLINNGACATVAGTTTSFKLPGQTPTSSNLFTVTVTCVETVYANATPPINIRTLTVVACNEPDGTNCPGTVRSVDYVERQLQATFQK